VTLWIDAAAAAAVYEWGFWIAVGLLAMTGIGNLAAFGAALPGQQTDYGGRLLTKLAAVAVLVVFSAWRTLVVARGVHRLGRMNRLIRTLYGITAALAAGVLALAVRLAHT
jgi:putative copper export protein